MGLDEFALCVRKEILPDNWVSGSVVLPITWEDVSFLDDVFEFRCRREIESDYAFKQIIPYVLSTTSDGELLIYKRHGTEARLHGLWSAGIGGHVNREDSVSTDFKATLIAGMSRECQEELGVVCRDFTLLGVINEEETEVGHAHLGIVFFTTIPKEIPASSELGNWEFVSLNQVQARDFELWSSLAIQLYCASKLVS